MGLLLTLGSPRQGCFSLVLELTNEDDSFQMMVLALFLQSGKRLPGPALYGLRKSGCAGLGCPWV